MLCFFAGQHINDDLQTAKAATPLVGETAQCYITNL